MQVQRYRQRISGPLLDRIDLHIEVPAVEYRDVASERVEEIPARFASGSAVRARISSNVFKATRRPIATRG